MSARTGAKPRLITAYGVTSSPNSRKRAGGGQQFGRIGYDVLEQQDAIASLYGPFDVLVGERAVRFRRLAHRDHRQSGHLRDDGGDDHSAEFGAADEVGVQVRR